MDESLKTQIETYLSHLDGLIRRGCQLRDMLTSDPSDKSAIAATRAWQEDAGWRRR
jgi:transposase